MKANRALLMLLLTSLSLTLGRQAQAENMKFFGTLIEPPSCVINNKHVIEVDFGDVLTSKIDGTQYGVLVTYSLECNNSSGKSLRMNILGKVSSFDPTALGSTVPGLGIRLYADGQVLPPGVAGYRFTYSKLPVLRAVPVKDSAATLPGGTFSAAATLEVEFL